MPEPSNQPACRCLLKALQARVVANYLADLGCPGLVAVALVVCGGAEGEGDALMGLGHPLHLKFMWHVIQQECVHLAKMIRQVKVCIGFLMRGSMARLGRWHLTLLA